MTVTELLSLYWCIFQLHNLSLNSMVKFPLNMDLDFLDLCICFGLPLLLHILGLGTAIKTISLVKSTL